jgi:hypothetical protein
VKADAFIASARKQQQNTTLTMNNKDITNPTKSSETSACENRQPPVTSAAEAKPDAGPLSQTAGAPDQKLMVVAICRSRDGRMVITPIDVEHDTDDLTPMSDAQMEVRKSLDQAFQSAQADMMKALGALHEIFSRRLYRNQFRTFENFCFAMYGTHRINDVLMKKVNARVNALKTEVNESL